MNDYVGDGWQDWDSAEYLKFLEEFYRKQLSIVFAIAEKYPDDYKIAVFGKIAPPAVYLKAEYEAWLKSHKKSQPTSQTRSEKKAFDADVLAGLDEALQGFLSVYRKDGRMVVEPTQFIPRNSFNEIHAHLKDEGFKYVARGDSGTGKGYWERG